MTSKEVLREALNLRLQDRFIVIEELLKSLDQPNEEIEAIWNNEIEKRSKALDEGTMRTVPVEEIFGK